ncbi:MAG: putative holliday junction DNA helicase (RuvA) [Leptospirillum sp. Group IV 'UBA BS']|nr:MAG: putative holliday junction DNA helicase (RuvA) [Leptospirillum sp. Group IV 'UBA BS']
MIARLWGTVLESGPESVIIRAGSVGYRVLLSPYSLALLSASQGPVSLRTFLLWSEHQESPLLVGFVDAAEEELFHEIRRIGGLGATKAIRMISLAPQEIWQFIAAGDVARLKKLKGVGETTARKLVSELRDRLPATLLLFVPPRAMTSPAGDPAGEAFRKPAGIADSVLDTLTRQFGHSPAEAEKMIRRALSRNPAVKSVEELFDEVYRHGVD